MIQFLYMDKQPENFKPIIKKTPDSNIDIILLMMRLKQGMKRFSNHLNGKDPKVIKIAMALMDQQYFTITNKILNEELSRLTSELETLINSPDASSPQKKAQRKVVAEKINIILE